MNLTISNNNYNYNLFSFTFYSITNIMKDIGTENEFDTIKICESERFPSSYLTDFNSQTITIKPDKSGMKHGCSWDKGGRINSCMSTSFHRSGRP